MWQYDSYAIHTHTQESLHTTSGGAGQDGYTPEILERTRRKKDFQHIWGERKLPHRDGEHRGRFLSTGLEGPDD